MSHPVNQFQVALLGVQPLIAGSALEPSEREGLTVGEIDDMVVGDETSAVLFDALWCGLRDAKTKAEATDLLNATIASIQAAIPVIGALPDAPAEIQRGVPETLPEEGSPSP